MSESFSLLLAAVLVPLAYEDFRLRRVGVVWLVLAGIIASAVGYADGGLRQMLADVFQMPVATTVNTEGPALGVAILAGVGAGLYASVPEACRAMIHVNPAQNPIAENVPQYEKVYALYTKLYQANKGLYKELAKL